VTELVREYREWTAAQMQQATEASIAVIYASAYGNTAALAQAISRGVSKSGVSIETVNCELSDAAEVAEIVSKSDGFVVGSPTLGGHMPTPVQLALGAILKDPEARAKPCGVFGSFGWSGEAVDELEQRLKDGGFNFAFPAIRCKFKPTEAMLQTCEESGTDLAQAVKKANSRARKSKEKTATSAASSAVEQAVGRVVGSLCVVTSKSGDAESAMLASWVSQASFNPPGLTVAVAKDRAVEGLVLEGGRFTLNVLGQDNASKVSKQLLKPFKPGEPRLKELETEESKAGGAILKDAIAYLDCTVKSRMETGDHWVLYAIADDGKLQNDRVLTAVHYRKTGARY
jgi:flavin reductase (DIM6/NTAB) family NADH-FMN oxidoreductase RutF/flavodoxin